MHTSGYTISQNGNNQAPNMVPARSFGYFPLLLQSAKQVQSTTASLAAQIVTVHSNQNPHKIQVTAQLHRRQNFQLLQTNISYEASSCYKRVKVSNLIPCKT